MSESDKHSGRSNPEPVPASLTAVVMEAESGCSRCPRRILTLEKAFLDERYAAVCVHCAADAYNARRPLGIVSDHVDQFDG